MNQHELVKRLEPTKDTLRELFLKSGNQCAFPGCPNLIIDEDGTFIAQICHIEAAETGGERFNPNMSNEDRRNYSNLMCMCYEHHTKTNDTELFDVDRLHQIKKDHEANFSDPERRTREAVSKLKWHTILGVGLIAGLALDNVLAQLKSLFVGNDNYSKSTPEPKELDVIHQILRYAPCGKVFWDANNDEVAAVATMLLSVFKKGGWRAGRRLKILANSEGNALEKNNHFVFIFYLSEENRIPNSTKAIQYALTKLGFSKSNSETNEVQYRSEPTLTLSVVITSDEQFKLQ